MNHHRLVSGAAIGAALLAGFVASAQGSPSATTLIINASIVDGTGSKAQKGAVRIDGERIVEVGALEPRQGERVVDAERQDTDARFHRRAQPP